MAKNHEPSDNKQATRKGIQKVNLSDLAGSLSKRGRESFKDEELTEAFRDALEDGQPFIWSTAVVTGDTDKAVNASKAKWRSRAVSVFKALGVKDKRVTVQWTNDNRMVVSVHNA